MIYSESNNLGDITINKAIIHDIISQSVKPWLYTGKLKILPNKIIKESDKGVYVCVHFSVALGESISEVCEKVSNYIVHELSNSLEMDVDDVVVIIDTMFTPKGNVVRRDIVFSFNDNKN